MKKLCYIVQGVTFLKSMMPLIIFSNNENIKPIIFFIKERAGKGYDSLIKEKDYIESILREHSVVCEYKWFDNQSQALGYMKNNNLNHIVCQDAQNHGKIFCCDNSIKVYSIGIFFDTLHYSKSLKLDNQKPSIGNIPDYIYFHNQVFLNEFISNLPEYPSNLKISPHPYFDHFNFYPNYLNDSFGRRIELPKLSISKTKVLCFLPANQMSISKSVQLEVEDLFAYYLSIGWKVIIKQRTKDPWQYHKKSWYDHNKVFIVNSEKGFPSTSLSAILSSDLLISSYSTAAVEANYLGIPNINLDLDLNKVNKSKVAISLLKNDLGEVFNNDMSVNYSEQSKISLKELSSIQINKKQKRLVNLDNSTVLLKNIIKELNRNADDKTTKTTE